MAFHVHAALAALCVAFVASQAHLPGQIYWNSMLPDVIMPSAISDALVSDAGKIEEIVPEGTEMDEVRVNKPPENFLYIYGHDSNKDEVRVNTQSENVYGHGSDKDEVRVNKPPENFLYIYGHDSDKDEVRVNTPSKKFYGHGSDKDEVRVNKPPENFLYIYGHDSNKGEVRVNIPSENVYGHGSDKDEVHVNKPPENFLYIYGHDSDKDEVRVNTPSENFYGHGSDKDEIRINRPPENFLYIYGHDSDKNEVRENKPSKSRDKDEIRVNRPPENFLYIYGHDKNEVKDEVVVNPPTIHFFLEKNLVPGKQWEMEFPKPKRDGYIFIPRQVADSIPFSSDKLSAILTQLSVEPESQKAQQMKDTLEHCESNLVVEGEVRACATSLEAMIDFVIQRLGKNIQAVATEPEKYTKLQNFTILPDVKRIGDDKVVSCHHMDYPYFVLFCHDLEGARAYTVPLQGTHGTKVKAVAVCHTNTSSWSPEHLAFKVLKVKPGGEPVCHFLPLRNVLWTASAQPHLAMPA